jgi:molecular chaperone DnaJ
LYITIEVEPHPVFRREGPNLHVKVPITVPEATLGAAIEVPTLEGQAVIKIPAGTKSGQKFRLKGQGAPLPGGKNQGDEYVEVTIVPPSAADPRVRELINELQKLGEPNPRTKNRVH